MKPDDIRPDVKLINSIHTLAVLRCEVKNYRYFADEKRKCIDEYAQSLKLFNDKIEFYDQELKKIRSAGTSDGLGGFSPASDVKFNELIKEKDKAEKEKHQWLHDNNHQFYSDICWWQSRIDTVEHYLDHLKEDDRKFINDLYIEPIGFKNVMRRYEISNEGNIYRKANNILRKVL
ncbi:MAG: hypothetical protein ACLUVC_00070 [Longibaculum sp.]